MIDIRGDLLERGDGNKGDHGGSWYRMFGTMLGYMMLGAPSGKYNPMPTKNHGQAQCPPPPKKHELVSKRFVCIFNGALENRIASTVSGREEAGKDEKTDSDIKGKTRINEASVHLAASFPPFTPSRFFEFRFIGVALQNRC